MSLIQHAINAIIIVVRHNLFYLRLRLSVCICAHVCECECVCVSESEWGINIDQVKEEEICIQIFII